MIKKNQTHKNYHVNKNIILEEDCSRTKQLTNKLSIKTEKCNKWIIIYIKIKIMLKNNK